MVRLMGMETEYAFRLPVDSSFASQRDAFLGLVGQLQVMLPVADADPIQSGKRGIFLGTGGAVWFESLRPSTNSGLIEGATPECLSPRQLLACQRAQDRLLEKSSNAIGVSLLKNCLDHRGKTYGAQENYEVEFARGASLTMWRAVAIVVLLPLCVFASTLAALIMLAGLVLLPIEIAIFYIVSWGKSGKERTRLFDFWIGRVFREGWDGVEIVSSGFFSRVLLWCILVLVFPAALVVCLVIEWTKLGQLQRELAPFLATRIIYAGAGHLAPDGKMRLAEKVKGCRRIATIVEYQHGFFSLGHFIKPILTMVRFAEVLAPRQRLQITMADSNLCEEAEYLRLGTTAIMLDMLEARRSGVKEARSSIPSMKNPVRAVHQINADLSLKAKVQMRTGESLTAIEIQRRYWSLCRQHLDSSEERNEEYEDVMNRWSEILDELERGPYALIGRLDWVTKKYLIEHSGKDLPFDARKKIDLRYHELSPVGYFRQFELTGLHVRVLREAEIEQASRLPPAGTPAVARARYIREYAVGGARVGWKSGR
jgi:Pup amidohydrolase